MLGLGSWIAEIVNCLQTDSLRIIDTKKHPSFVAVSRMLFLMSVNKKCLMISKCNSTPNLDPVLQSALKTAIFLTVSVAV